ncbi:branched-chain amino acid transport system ATP-binding protein [Prauserella sediminis]|uniref:Branched-chain amino acid transport system ATP-binding protein n=1 Tax=Prauserella sediminis TaxID=577680 RepID=A0A839XVV2_9PSEU|nr:ABC transporter ATP-binding protein [Prauserella sediminis]MBB3665188.1 branched-chain amino acid transport system ATP-binding protein [Prauserella sediminis]
MTSSALAGAGAGDGRDAEVATSVLRADDVAVHFGGVKAVDGVSIVLTPGRLFGILGPNGSGKSTLLAALTRLVPLTRGRLEFEGRRYDRVRPHTIAARGVARTFQTVRILPGRTVFDNVALGAESAGSGSKAERGRARERVRRAIERTGLSGKERHRPDELSYGHQRRVEIARAIASEPTLLLLDEPTAGMNRQERDDITGLLADLRAEGLTQLLIEHDVQMMVDACDHLFAMNFGALIAEGEPEAVVRHPAVQEAYLGTQGRAHA